MNRTWLGVGIVVILALALIVVLASGGDDAPATTTTTVTQTAAATTAPPTTTTTTTAAPTTTPTVAPVTTLDPAARAAEIEALVRDLDLQLFQAVFDQDAPALAEVVGGKRLWDRLQAAFTDPDQYFSSRPTSGAFSLDLDEVLLDRADCIVADVDEDARAFYLDYEEIDEWIVVLWNAEDAPRGWRIAELWASGIPESEWLRNCDIQDRSWRP